MPCAEQELHVDGGDLVVNGISVADSPHYLLCGSPPSFSPLATASATAIVQLCPSGGGKSAVVFEDEADPSSQVALVMAADGSELQARVH